MTSTGWTWETCLDQLTTSRMTALRKQWIKYPPTHKLLAAFAGYTAPPDAGTTAVDRPQYMTSEMAARFIDQGGVLISAAMLRGG